eukprot:m.285394 g.285394  ORF g.285394 m.285394 type:complete len:1205 (-) comp15776_c0_seq1:3067-6681(-)
MASSPPPSRAESSLAALQDQMKSKRLARVKALRRHVRMVYLAKKATPSRVGTIMPFTSRQLRRFFVDRSSTTLDPSGDVKHGAVLFADCSGFTSLTEQLATKEGGAEELSAILNKFLTSLITIAYEFRGDIVKFAGDAITITFLTEDIDVEDGVDPMRECARAACQCALKLLQICPYTAVEATKDSPPIILDLHMGVGVGSFSAMHIGGTFRRWEYLLAGSPLRQIAIAEPAAANGTTVLSPETIKLLGDDIVTEELDIDWEQSKVTPTDETGNLLQGDDRIQYLKGFKQIMGVLKPSIQTIPPPVRIPEYLVDTIRGYIPKAARIKMETARERLQAAEIRAITVLFITVKGLNLSPIGNSCSKATSQAQVVMLELQRVIFNYGGAINKLMVDDKGFVALAVFGVAPWIHPDDPARGVCAALDVTDAIGELQRKKAEFEISTSVGVSTGNVFCGVVGSPDRHEYTVLGDSVNLAARLMGKAGKNGVLVDEATRSQVLELAGGSFTYDVLVPISLKGKARPVPVFKPHSIQYELGKQLQWKEEDGVVAGREEELEQLQRWTASLSSTLGGVMMMLAHSCNSSTNLIKAIASYATAQGMVVIATQGHEQTGDARAEQTAIDGQNAQLNMFDTPLRTFAAILKQLFNEVRVKGHEPHAWINDVLSEPETDPKLRTVVPAFQALLEDEPDEDLPRYPLRLLQSAMNHIIFSFSAKYPLFLAMRFNSEYIGSYTDDVTWNSLDTIARQIPHRLNGPSAKVAPLILFVASGLEVKESDSAVVQELYSIAKNSRKLLVLKRLEKHAALRWAAHCLSLQAPKHVTVKTASIPPPLVRLLEERGAGYPKIISTLIHSLFRPGALISGGPAAVKWESGRIELLGPISQIVIPVSLKRAVLSAYEVLRGSLQLLVKCACVFPAFTCEMVSTTLAGATQKPQSIAAIQAELSQLVEREILTITTEVPRCIELFMPGDRFASPIYVFSSQLLQAELQQLIVPSLRNALKEEYQTRVRRVLRAVLIIQKWVRKASGKSTSAMHPEDAAALDPDGHSRFLDNVLDQDVTIPAPLNGADFEESPAQSRSQSQSSRGSRRFSLEAEPRRRFSIDSPSVIESDVGRPKQRRSTLATSVASSFVLPGCEPPVVFRRGSTTSERYWKTIEKAQSHLTQAGNLLTDLNGSERLVGLLQDGLVEMERIVREFQNLSISSNQQQQSS